ncbi:polysaccharide deacetylase family protein [Clostridium sp. 19966]|uniref:polysaccharide deacetylase family protein n=1 Tax=Clostridium sp. 19966 TaxID=2768166 RepID=UPI0028E73495|nr:polysaccharide deacetylase family protein [Clostridium sp. 19966]
MCIENNKKLIALTFDDGPSNVTNQVLDKLEKYSVTASFFLIGQNISPEKKPLLQRQIQLGCEICNHSWSHPAMSNMTKEDIIDEFQKTNEVIHSEAGVYPKFFRPPYIALSDVMYEAIDLPFICGVGCNDWEDSVSSAQRAETILNSASDGTIILMHDAEDNIKTVEALDTIIPELKERGFCFVTVSQLFQQKSVNPSVKYKIWTNIKD